MPQYPVIDATNLIQNTLNQINTYTTTLNQVRQIANQVQSLANQALNLERLPSTIMGDLTGTIGQYTAILQQAQGLTYQFSAIQGQFQRLYPNVQQPLGLAAYLKTLPDTSQATYYALQDAMRAQAALDRLLKERTQLDTAMAHSAQAVGAVQAQQAATEVQGIMVQQLNGLQEMQAAIGRAQATMLANQTIADGAARTEVHSRMTDTPGTPPAPGTIQLMTLDGKPIPQ
jgi:P-type conjugative transfer protein TrbJ